MVDYNITHYGTAQNWALHLYTSYYELTHSFFSYFILVENNIRINSLFKWYLQWITNQNVQQWVTTNVNIYCRASFNFSRILVTLGVLYLN